MKKPAIKICGLTNYEDANLAAELGADFLGFIFAESPRKVKPETVYDILTKLKRRNQGLQFQTVGVFVNENLDRVEKIAKISGIDIVQFHGDEKIEDIRLCSLPWYKALRFSKKENVENEISRWDCSRILVDTAVKGMYGGTGKTMDKELAFYCREVVQKNGKEFYLAGGITSSNVYNILKVVRPDGIDIGSGIEEYKRKKSDVKMRLLFESINSYIIDMSKLNDR